ncbi:hypothetical protein C8N46_10643 [Kordia periserrulae]|uniref:Uncharacterized protein n=1 Tax=Kordia periserrulae TaxID=701523 RepID=A0A2T6BWG2_9FLAO|nr:DUF6168 family protein [Kordia periserrulae]PTX60399.1 hypothetical protein C8N46_10643 [Kordia periserrulae]
MIRQIFIYITAFGLLFFLGDFLHNYYIESQEISLGFSLRKIYAFHAFFSLQLCVVFALLSNNEKLRPQLGFIYLGSFVLKIIIFCIAFYNILFVGQKLSNTQRISLIIPMLVFLILEVHFMIKILNKNHSPK